MKKLAIAAALAATLMLSGCAADHSSHDSTGTEQSTKMTAEAMYVAMMAPHHQQALDMVALAEKNTATPAILKLAEGIKNAQTAELAQFNTWLTDNGVSSDPMNMESGLLTDNEMSALAAATGTDFDALFLAGMIKHHQGAVDMSQPLIESTDSQVAKWAQGIYVGQQTEILVMQALQNRMN